MTDDLNAMFHLHTHSGNVTVRDAGVYYVYSQVSKLISDISFRGQLIISKPCYSEGLLF